MMTTLAYGIGYSGRNLDELQRIVEVLDVYLVDIRFAPYSRNPDFRKTTLEKTFGDRYIYLQAFGNRNYKGGPVDIVNYEEGKAVVEALDKSALLICMCKDPTTCHRTVVLHRLAEDGFEVQDWEGGNVQQLSLW